MIQVGAFTPSRLLALAIRGPIHCLISHAQYLLDISRWFKLLGTEDEWQPLLHIM